MHNKMSQVSYLENGFIAFKNKLKSYFERTAFKVVVAQGISDFRPDRRCFNLDAGISFRDRSVSQNVQTCTGAREIMGTRRQREARDDTALQKTARRPNLE